jgi:hypothetical protein
LQDDDANGDVRETPFCEFNRIYPSWKTPDVSASAQEILGRPRRYLFYTHFSEIARKYDAEEERPEAIPEYFRTETAMSLSFDL